MSIPEYILVLFSVPGWMVLLIFLWNFIYMYEFGYNTLRYIINFTIEIMCNCIIFYNGIWWFKFYCLKDGIFELKKKILRKIVWKCFLYVFMLLYCLQWTMQYKNLFSVPMNHTSLCILIFWVHTQLMCFFRTLCSLEW